MSTQDQLTDLWHAGQFELKGAEQQRPLTPGAMLAMWVSDKPLSHQNLPPEERTFMAISEPISQFEVEGVSFYVLWKPGLCLLRTIESPGSPNPRHYTVADIFRDSYDGSADFMLDQDTAVRLAPDVARRLVAAQRQQELGMLSKLYASPTLQKDYPAYVIWQSDDRGTSVPVIWASHNAGLYCRVGMIWQNIGFAKSREEAEAKVGAFLESVPIKPGTQKHWPIRLFGVVCVAIGFWLMAGLIPAFGDMFSHANSKREVSGVLAMPMIGLLLILFGGVAVWRPTWLVKA